MAGGGEQGLSQHSTPCSEPRRAGTARAGHGVGKGTCRRHSKGRRLCASRAAQDCRVQQQPGIRQGKHLQLRRGSGKTLASVIRESILEVGLPEIINAPQIQVGRTSGAEIFSVTFLK